MEKKRRRNYTGEEKVLILKRHLIDREEISRICEENHLQPSQFYLWQKQFFENGAVAFSSKSKQQKESRKETQKIAQLESKLTRKNEVLSELLEEHVQLKKELGEL